MGRKFKKKLAPRIKEKRINSVFSVELIRKETLEKVRVWINRFYKFIRNYEPRTNNQ